MRQAVYAQEEQPAADTAALRDGAVEAFQQNLWNGAFDERFSQSVNQVEPVKYPQELVG